MLSGHHLGILNTFNLGKLRSGGTIKCPGGLDPKLKLGPVSGTLASPKLIVSCKKEERK
jgi:hypothetical protein